MHHCFRFCCHYRSSASDVSVHFLTRKFFYPYKLACNRWVLFLAYNNGLAYIHFGFDFILTPSDVPLHESLNLLLLKLTDVYRIGGFMNII